MDALVPVNHDLTPLTAFVCEVADGETAISVQVTPSADETDEINSGGSLVTIKPVDVVVSKTADFVAESVSVTCNYYVKDHTTVSGRVFTRYQEEGLDSNMIIDYTSFTLSDKLELVGEYHYQGRVGDLTVRTDIYLTIVMIISCYWS
jgi:hypothetical protein